MCTFWEARERYLNSLSARNWVSILAMSSWNISEKGEVAAKARMDLCEPDELLGWPASKMTPLLCKQAGKKTGQGGLQDEACCLHHDWCPRATWPKSET